MTGGPPLSSSGACPDSVGVLFASVISVLGRLFLCNNAANLPLCFQSIAGCYSRNLFPFKLLHCCPGVGILPPPFPSSFTLTPHLRSPLPCLPRAARGASREHPCRPLCTMRVANPEWPILE